MPSSSNFQMVLNELKTQENIKKCRSEFEMDNGLGGNEATFRCESESHECIELQMDSVDDKEYDIEEIKFWNFVAKNESAIKPTVRTMVYKYPDSSYVVRKTRVNLNRSKPPVDTGQTQRNVSNERSSKGWPPTTTRPIGRTRMNSNFIKLERAKFSSIDESAQEDGFIMSEASHSSLQFDIISRLNPIARGFSRRSPTNPTSEVQRFVAPTEYRVEDFILPHSSNDDYTSHSTDL